MKIRAILEAKYYQADKVDLSKSADRPGFQEQVNDLWTKGVFYKGDNVHDLVYQSGISGKAEEYMTTYNKEHNDVYDVESQDSYLGYAPKTDTFYNGFDTWPENHDGEMVEGETQNIVGFKIQDGNMVDVHIVQIYERMMYPAGLRSLKQQEPTLIDIRLS